MTTCKTKYPIMLIHGTGTRDDGRLSCWGRIPTALESEGATVFFSNQDAWGTIEENAESVKERALAVLSESGSEKLNIIALSKGGLEARYMIHKFDMGDKVASLTTISTPHRGSKTIDFLYRKFSPIMRFVAIFANCISRWKGDRNPDFYSICKQFSTAYCEKFNRDVLDSDKVYYQSFASSMKKSYSDMLLFVPHAFVKFFDGECDGIVSVDSAKWGEFKGVITGGRVRGVSHSDLRDLRRMGPLGKKIIGEYIAIVSGLKEMGF